jgi:uncharacterized protein YkwD
MRQTRVKRSASKHISHAVRQAVVPHAHNDYRPHLIRLPSIIAILFAIFLFQMAYNVSQTGSILGRTTDITTQDLLDRTNQVRSDNGESGLTLNTKLARAAALKADDMFANQYWSHTSPSGVEPWTWFKKAGYSYSDAGENLAKNFHSTGGVVTAWMDSEEHRANILDLRYKEVGFAVKSGELDGETTTVVVALYGNPQSGEAVAGAATTAAASMGEGQSVISRLGVGVQSMTPALVGSIFLLSLVAVVALLAHGYRNQLPNGWRRSWKRHHGAYTALSAVSFVMVIVTLYGGGQI